MKSFYFVDQVENIKSGPGIFVKNILSINDKLETELIIVSQDIKKSTNNLKKIPSIKIFNGNKLSTLINQFIYSLYFIIYRIRYRKSKFFINSFYQIIFSFWIGKYYLFINDLKFLERNKLIILLFKIICKRSKLLIFNSEKSLSELKKIINVRHHFILHKIFLMSSKFNQKKKPNNQLIITFCKNDWKYGGLYDSLDFLNEIHHDKILFRIIGISEKEKEAIKKLIIKTNFKHPFEIYGILPNQEILNLLSESHIFLNFCHFEAFGVAAIEAILNNNLLISLDRNNGLNQLMKKYSFGLLVSNKNDFKMKITNFYNDENLIKKINNDIEIVKRNFGESKFINKVKKLFSFNYVH